ncbi:MAG: ATPase [Gammaproteobacteria bacterium]|nr:ATPase [Gammaproteobacteria bacterium]
MVNAPHHETSPQTVTHTQVSPVESVEVVADAVGPRSPGVQPAWRAMLYLGGYRLTLATLIVVLAVLGVAPRDVWQVDSLLFRNVALAYLGIAALEGIFILLRRPAFKWQLVGQFLVDILALCTLMHAAGGVGSGYGILVVVAVAGVAVLTGGRIAIAVAALASLCILAEELYVHFGRVGWSPNYTHAGLLGAAAFSAAILANLSARRIRMSEALAERRGIDLANLSALNEHIIQRMQAGVVAIDDRGRTRFMNESALRLLAFTGASSGANSGLPLDAVDDRLAALHGQWQADRSQPSYYFQASSRDLQLVASFAGLGPAAADGTVIFLEDVAATAQRAQQLKLASLGRLAASIAHEIRNPLGAISHAAQLLEESPRLHATDVRLIRIVIENSARMNRMVETILELGRGRPAELQMVEMAAWLERFVAEFLSQRPAAVGVLEYSVETDVLQVVMDPEQLHQVVWNLCDNALQHAAEAPSVRLLAGVSAETDRPYLDVIDNGPGIPADEQDKVFEPFYTTRNEGTGLGLYVAREICEANKASLSLAHAEHGCRFRITFADPRRREAIPA